MKKQTAGSAVVVLNRALNETGFTLADLNDSSGWTMSQIKGIRSGKLVLEDGDREALAAFLALPSLDNARVSLTPTLARWPRSPYIEAVAYALNAEWVYGVDRDDVRRVTQESLTEFERTAVSKELSRRKGKSPLGTRQPTWWDVYLDLVKNNTVRLPVECARAVASVLDLPGVDPYLRSADVCTAYLGVRSAQGELDHYRQQVREAEDAMQAARDALVEATSRLVEGA